jgi:glycolate oxidase iron-sulfur subunit
LRCNKCGFCQAHCPIYKVTGVEWTTARGRISLIRSALLDKELEVKEIHAPVNNCLTCNACVDDCPAGVQTADIIFQIREELHQTKWMNQLIFHRLLANPALLNRAAGLLRLSDISGLRTAIRRTGLIKLIGESGKAEVLVPKVPAGTGLSKIIKLTKKIESPRYKIAYFVGCYAANLAPREAAATINVLHKHRVEVAIPEFVCCGMPASASGETSTALSLARRNIIIADKLNIDAIITPCASCSSFLKGYQKLLAQDPEWAKRALNFSSKVRDLNEFLVDIGLVTEMRTIKKRVSYHDPCHLVRYQKIRQQPRTILKSIPGIDYVELKEADMCCGAAGSYGFKNYDLSMKVLARKMDHVQEAEAEILISNCPACVAQLSLGVEKRKMQVRTLSVAELLDQALAIDGR